MLARTKWMMAGIGTLLLVGTAFAVAADNTSLTADVAASASWQEGSWTKDGSAVKGEFVSFALDAANGTISDYAEQGRTIFMSIVLANYNASEAKARGHGRLIAFADGADARGVLFDARNAAFAIRAPAGNNVTLVVADGTTIEHHNSDPGWAREGVLLRQGNHTARLVVDGASNVTVSGQTIVVTLAPHGGLAFRLDGHPFEAAKEKLALLKLERAATKDLRADKVDLRKDERKLRAVGMGAKKN